MRFEQVAGSITLKLTLAGLLVAGFAAPAGDPAGYHLWRSAELKAFRNTLAPKIEPKFKYATSGSLASVGNYGFSMSHREGIGEVEYHETQADIMIVQSGEATVLYGGNMVDKTIKSPGELRSITSTGGTEVKIGVGDVMTIPAKMPHQVRVNPGKEITYMLVKVTTP
jgi:mannose-6-phosphate isomerase-like protein (cupin superfamily)